MGSKRGQATTEVVLLFPIFLIIVFITAKIFALLVLVQKMEIASYYAARKWQLESHRNIKYTDTDESYLKSKILDNVRDYLGFGTPPVQTFLKLNTASLDIQRTQVWNVVTLTVRTDPAGVKILCLYPIDKVCSKPYGNACEVGYKYICTSGGTLEVIKYVPNRDRPIQFELPGLQ